MLEYDPELEDFIEEFIDDDFDLSEEPDVNSTASDITDEASKDAELQVVRRRRRRRNMAVAAPRVPRLLVQDIRRLYSKMYPNVMNSGDFNLIYGFLDTYCSRDVYHNSRKVVKLGDSRKVYSMKVHGVDNLAKFWYSFMYLSPDGIYRLTDSAMQHTTGKIICKMHKEGTVVYELHDRSDEFVEYFMVPSVVGIHDKEEYFSSEGSFSSSSSEETQLQRYKKRRMPDEVVEEHVSMEKLANMREIMESVEESVGRLGLRKIPLNLSMDGTFVICTDENKRICRFEASVEY